jgi:hypothetical protein
MFSTLLRLMIALTACAVIPRCFGPEPFEDPVVQPSAPISEVVARAETAAPSPDPGSSEDGAVEGTLLRVGAAASSAVKPVR